MPTSQRNVSWIELFYDLIFVAAAHQLTLILAHSLSLVDAVQSLLLFIPILWCWMSHTLFTNLFSDRSWFYEFATFFTILGTVVMVILMPTALYENEALFAFAYMFVKIILVLQYLVWGILEFQRFVQTVPQVIGNLGSAVLWGLSILSANPAVWWTLAMVIDIATPLLTKTRDVASNMNPHHLPERLGLLTVIVLGEMIITLIISAFDLPLNRELALVLGTGIGITFLIFWTYFRFIGQAIVGFNKSTSRIYFMSHLPMVIGLICMAGGYKGILGGEDTSYLLIMGIMIFTLSQRMLRYVQDQRFLKRQLVCAGLLLPILTWYYFFAASALINLAVLSGSLAVYLVISEYILGWNDFSEKNAPTDKIEWSR